MSTEETKDKGREGDIPQQESTSNVASLSHSSSYVNVSELKSRAKLTSKANKDTGERNTTSKENKEVDTNLPDIEKDAERKLSMSSPKDTFKVPPLSYLDQNESDSISKTNSHHNNGNLRVSQSGSGSSKRKPSGGGDSLSSASASVREGLTLKKRLKIGQNVLIPANSISIGSDQSIFFDGTHKESIYVNAKGFPPGQGMTVAERHGPYLFVLAEIVKLHFENYFVSYSVKRHDTHRIQKVDRGE